MSPKEHVIKPLTFYKKKDIQFLPKKPSAQKLHTLKTGWSFCCSVMEIFKTTYFRNQMELKINDQFLEIPKPSHIRR